MTNKLAIVLGAHRSGTSLITAGLESLGACLGKKSTYVSTENPKGFFEIEDIVSLNDRLLEYLGGRWDNPLFDGRQALANKSTEHLNHWYDEAKAIFLTNFEKCEFIAIKDPRICQLLPFWLEVFRQCGYKNKNIFYVHICRHPLEVAQSQSKRKQDNPDFYLLGESLMETVSLWMSLSYQSLRDSKSDQSIFLSYPELLNDPKGTIERIASFLDVQCCNEKISEYCHDFVEQGLRRNIVSPSDEELLMREFPEALTFFKVQMELVSKESFSRADAQKALKVWKQSAMQQHFLKPIIPLFSEAVSQRWILNQQITELKKTLDQVNSYNRESKAALDEATTNEERIQTELEDIVSDRDQVRAELNEVRSSRDALQAELVEVSLDRDRFRAEITEVRSSRDALQTELAGVTTDRDQIKVKLTEISSSRDTLQTELARIMSENDRLGTQLKDVISDRERQRVESEAAYQKQVESRLEAEQTIAAMKRTLSWRITAPLRVVRHLQKKLVFHFSSLIRNAKKKNTDIKAVSSKFQE